MDIHQSLDRILRRSDVVVDLFYVVFLDRHPDVQEFFHDVDLRRQAILLTIALKVIEHVYIGGYPAAEMYLRYLGTKHSDRGIPEDLYPKWRNAMLDTLARFHGQEWNQSLQQQWHEAIDRASSLMIEGYHERFRM